MCIYMYYMYMLYAYMIYIHNLFFILFHHALGGLFSYFILNSFFIER